MQAACAATTRTRARRREENQHLVFLVSVLSFASLNSVSPVLCLERELRPLVHFDGELLMVSFCCLLSAMMYLFWGRGGGGQRLLCGEGHIIGLQGKHAVHC